MKTEAERKHLPDHILNDIIEGEYTLEEIERIDTDHWGDDYIDLLITLTKIKKQDKSLTMENIYKAGGQIVFLTAMKVVTRIEHEQDRVRKQ